MTDKENILDFFLNLFKLSCKNPNPGPQSQEYQRVPQGKGGGDEVYELRVRCGGQWETRRMSISQLSELVESKSTCFKVIFDEQMVIKIPPKPFTDFDKYMAYIHNERHIVSCLSPAIPSLSPCLSVILSKVPELNMLDAPEDEDLETKFIHLLTTRPRLQKYLKIGEGFVFFMRLSKSAFLNQVIAKIHDQAYARREMLQNIGIFEDLYAFEALYGDQYEDVFFKINGLFTEYKKIIDILMPQYDNYDELQAYKKQEWFYCKLMGEPLDLDQNGLSAEFAEDLNTMLDVLLAEKEAAVYQYRLITEKYILKKVFENNRKNIEGVIINLMNLIHHLKNQGVVIRDLKPDNIFIDQNPNVEDLYLGNPSLYAMGLIDLETAVHLHPGDMENMKQPLLAGTFPYMTPHHLFMNTVLRSIYGPETCRVLYMQDWFATIGMIYNAATNKTLFTKTAKLMQKIFEIKKKAAQEKKPLAGVLKSVSWNFWHTATTECHQKLALHKDKLERMHLQFRKPVVIMLKEELKLEADILNQSIEERIRTKPYLEKRRQKLMKAGSRKIAQYRKRWEGGELGEELPDTERAKMSVIMKGIESLKRRMESHETLKTQIEEGMTCDAWIAFLLNLTLNAMYRQFWSYKEYPGNLPEHPGGAIGGAID